MILCLNNMKNFSRANDTYRKCIDSKTFPKQDLEKLGKLIHLKFRDENDQYTRFRLPINKKNFPQFSGETNNESWFFRIIRYDIEFPYKVILIDKNKRIIVTDRTKITELFVHPDYKFSISSDGFKELELVYSEDWDTFNNLYLKDYVHCYPVQDKELLGISVYIEYYNDLFNLKSEDQLKEINIDNQKKSKDELRKGLEEGNIKRNTLNDGSLFTFPIYYDRHQKDMVDIPKRVIKKGVIIRVDMNATDPEIVVAQFDDNNKLSFITDKEATFYYDSNNVNKIDLESLNIWQNQLI